MTAWIRKKRDDSSVDMTEAEDIGENGLPDEEPAKGGLLSRVRRGLAKTRNALGGRVDDLVRGKNRIDDELFGQLEEILITADIGVATTMGLIDDLRTRVDKKQLSDPVKLKDALKEEIARSFENDPPPFLGGGEKPAVILMVGVNGVGKTTTIAKLANRFKAGGDKVLLAAGDTFRAAAVEQLTIWAERVGADIVGQKTGSDPSAVAFDAIEAALARGVDVVIVDTAGRLHTQKNLMEELKKIHRVIGKKLEGAPHEVLLVLDATTGQNALSQARLFTEAVGVTGVVLAKLDGTAKGGIVIAIRQELGLPIRFVGLGEGMDDLRPFDAWEFVDALL